MRRSQALLILFSLLLAFSGVLAGGRKVDPQFGDGPTPFPVIVPDDGVRQYLATDTWVVRVPGGIVFHDCADRGNAISPVVPAVRVAGPQIQAALRDIKDGFERIAPYVEDEDLNAVWVEYAATRYASETVLSKSPLPQPEQPSCTSGRCDCVSCPSDRTCGCETYNRSTANCAAPRASCNTDAPKAQ